LFIARQWFDVQRVDAVVDVNNSAWALVVAPQRARSASDAARVRSFRSE
jgi:hypothetical protein